MFEGQRYNKDSAGMLDFCNDDYVFGRIECVYFLNDGPYLLCSKLSTVNFNSHYHAYVVEDTTELCLLAIQYLYDYHPLGLYNISNLTLVPLRHYIHEPVHDISGAYTGQS